MSKQTDLEHDAHMCWTEVSLSAILSNYQTFRDYVAASVEVFPVIKADAYGHGSVAVAKVLQQAGVQRLCVARIEEAIELRASDINTKILVFAPPLLPQALLAAQYELEIVICADLHREAVAQAQKITGRSIPVHIKTDIGMNRLGMPIDSVLPFLHRCRADNVQVMGVMSHFPCADSSERNQTVNSVEQLKSLYEKLIAEDYDLIFHACNSAATMQFPEAWFNAVRVGISLYGQQPSLEMPHVLPLVPGMSLFSKIIYIKDVPAGTPVSYCHTYHTKTPSRLATLAIGYADGFPRHASGLSDFIIHGKPAPQVGRVCMDQVVVDISHIPDASIGDVAMAFGTDGNNSHQVEEVAAKMGTIGYELTTRIGRRVPRLYV